MLIRHAEVEDRYQGVFGGILDIGISPRGQAQAERLAEYLKSKPIDTLYTSPMKRVRQTLAPMLRNGSPQPIITAELREIDFGDWTGVSWDSLPGKFGVSAFDWLDEIERGSVPNGETGAAFRARIVSCLRRITTLDSGKAVCVYCHGGVVRMMLSILLDLPLPKTSQFEIAYASVTEISLGPRKAELTLLNFTPWGNTKL